MYENKSMTHRFFTTVAIASTDFYLVTTFGAEIKKANHYVFISRDFGSKIYPKFKIA